MSESLVKGFLERKFNDSQFEIFEESLFGKSKSNVGKTRTLNEYERKVIDLIDDDLCDLIESQNTMVAVNQYKPIGRKITKLSFMHTPRSKIVVDTNVNKRTGIELTRVKYGTIPQSFTRCKLTKR